jgi:hypothetical protein
MNERIQEKWTAKLCKALTTTGLKCFARREADAALNPLKKSDDRKTTVERAVRLQTVCEKPDLWNGYPWFGI